MKYDPVKRSLGSVFNATPVLRKLFYWLLDLLLLRAWYIKKELKKWGKNRKGMQVLDAGSGFGQYVYRMASIGTDWTVKGVDVKQEQIDDCNQFFEQINLQNRVSFEYADLVRFDEKEKYDLILSVDVMEHILEDEQVFQNFYAAMRKDGMLLISTPSDQGGSDVHDHDHDESFIDEHVRDGYGITDITEKLQRAGFKNIEANYAYGTAGSISWKLSMKYPIIMLNASKLFFVLLPFYYLLTYPFAYVLNHIDVANKQASGTGLVVRATK